MATNFWKYTGSEQRRYPDWRLTADPGYVYDFGAGSQPNDGRWVSDPGPATAPPPPVLPGVQPAGPQQGMVPVWDSTSAAYKPTDLGLTYAKGVVSPTQPAPAAGSGEYLWFKTDGNGNLLDILAGKV